jgi:hypothetical protein
MANDGASLDQKKKVGLVEIPDESLELVSHYTQSDEWQAAVVISTVHNSYAERLARILGIPVCEVPSRDQLMQCDLVIIGSEASPQFASIREMLAGTPVRVALLDEVVSGESGGEAATAERTGTVEVVEVDPVSATGDLSLGLDAALSASLNLPSEEAPEEEPEEDSSELSEINRALDGLIGIQTKEEPADEASAGDPSGSSGGVIQFVGTEPTGAVEARDHDADAAPAAVDPLAGLAGGEAGEDPAPTFDISAEAEDPVPEYDISVEAEEVVTEHDISGEVEEEPAAAEPVSGHYTYPEPEAPVHDISEEAGDDAEELDFSEDAEEPGDAIEESEAPEEMDQEAVESPVAEKGQGDIGDEPIVVELPEEPATSEIEEESTAAGIAEEPTDFPVEAVVEEDAIVSSEADMAESVPTAEEEAEGTAQSGFDLSVLLGRSMARKLGPVQIDPGNRELLNFLDMVLEATGAKAGSIMLPDADEEHLRIAVAVGLSPDIVSRSRIKIGEGLVGKAFASAEPQSIHAEVPNLAEAGGSQQQRVAASDPTLRDGRAFGVLTVNVEAEGEISKDEVLGALVAFAQQLQAPIFEAIDLTKLTLQMRQQILTRHLDRVMSQDSGFTERLRSLGDVLRSAVNADYMHLYAIDSENRRLELVSEVQGMAATTGKHQPLDCGLFGSLVRKGSSRLVTIPDTDSKDEQGVAYLIVNTNRPYGLMILENFPVKAEEKKDLETMLTTVVEQVEDIFEVEQGVATQDILSQIRLRITERAREFSSLPAELRTQPALEMAIDELAGEVAMWIPGAGQRPVITQPQGRQAAKILADVWDTLDEMSQWIRSKGSGACGATGTGWDAKGPEGPSPYVGVKEPDGDGVLLLFFARIEDSKTTMRLPVRVLSEALLNICQIIHSEDEDTGSMSSNGDDQDIDQLLTEEQLESRIQDETIRSQRSGMRFALTRFSLEGGLEDRARLRLVLINNKRNVDVIAEMDDGSFVLLSPDTSSAESHGIQNRFAERWEEQGTEAPLSIEPYQPSARGGEESFDEHEPPAANAA